MQLQNRFAALELEDEDTETVGSHPDRPLLTYTAEMYLCEYKDAALNEAGELPRVGDSLRCTDVRRLNNATLTNRYLACLRHLEAEGRQPRCVWMWHGTNTKAMNQIAKRGFLMPGDATYARAHGWNYGRGIYLAFPLWKAWYYRSRDNEVLLCRVILSRVFRIKAGDTCMLNQPCKSGFDVHATYNQAVLFDRDRVLPMYRLRVHPHTEYHDESVCMQCYLGISFLGIVIAVLLFLIPIGVAFLLCAALDQCKIWRAHRLTRVFILGACMLLYLTLVRWIWLCITAHDNRALEISSTP